MEERATKKVVVDAGHGGSDPGTIANGITEKEYTLKISKYINDRLNELGIDSSLTRDSDITLNPTDRPKKVQSFYGNGNDVVVLSNHINAGGGDGAEVIYALRNSDALSRKITQEFENAGQNVRKYYQRRLPSNPAKDYYYIHRDTPNNETVIVEYGFADSSGDDVEQIKNDWEKLAEAVVKATTEYVGGKYIAPLGSNYYTVQKGESLWSISKKLGVTVDELKEVNNLQNNLLSIGQNLLIPGMNEEQEEMKSTYTVKSGDTLYKIANQFNTTVDNLKDINNLSSDSLQIGQVLNLPSGNTNEYIVQSGDTLYSIAMNFGTNVDSLKSLNNLNSNLLSIGQVLKLPSNNTTKIYTVKKGDSLYSIARENGTTVSVLESLNNLSTSTLSIGQKLFLP